MQSAIINGATTMEVIVHVQVLAHQVGLATIFVTLHATMRVVDMMVGIVFQLVHQPHFALQVHH
jgi:hypothetical protein